MISNATKEAVAHAVGELEGRLESLVSALSHEQVWIDAADADSHEESVRKACDALGTIDYAMEDAPESRLDYLAVLGVSPHILKIAHSVNDAKLELKTVCGRLQGHRTRVPVKGQSGTKAISTIRVLLRNIQRSNLNLWAAYRKVPILPVLPASISYTVARTRPVHRRTVDQIFELLSVREGPRAARDRDRLESLPRSEKHLALVRGHYANIRANIRYARLDPRGRGRVQCVAELPLLFALREKDAAPEVTFPREAGLADGPRRDREPLLDEAAFLESLPVFRYLA